MIAVTTRIRAMALLCIVVGCGLALQSIRGLGWTDAAGTVLYVAAIAAGLLVCRPTMAPGRPTGLALIAGLIAFLVECWQVTGMPADLVARVPWARLVTGTTFSWGDVVWIAAAVPVVRTLLQLSHFDRLPRQRWWTAATVVTIGAVIAVVGTVVAGVLTALDGVGWAAWTAGAAIVLSGLVDLVRGASRDDHRPDRDVLLGRAAVLGSLAVVAVLALTIVLQGIGAGPVRAAVGLLALTGLGALFAAIAGHGDGVPQRGRILVGLMIALVVVLLAQLVGQRPSPARLPDPSSTRTLAPIDGTAPTPAPPVDARPVRPAPEAGPRVPLCAAHDLSARTQGWDAAMGDTWVSIVVTNEGARACALTGLPRIELAQGDAPLTLEIDHSSPDGTGAERARRVRLAPGAGATVVLGWPGYRTAADQVTPQTLTLLAPKVGAVPVILDQGPAPFDLIDGGRISISAWR